MWFGQNIKFHIGILCEARTTWARTKYKKIKLTTTLMMIVWISSPLPLPYFQLYSIEFRRRSLSESKRQHSTRLEILQRSVHVNRNSFHSRVQNWRDFLTTFDLCVKSDWSTANECKKHQRNMNSLSLKACQSFFFGV